MSKNSGGKHNSACGVSEQFIDTLCAPPEVCANAQDSKQQHLIVHAREPEDPKGNFVTRTIKRDKPLLVAILLLAIFVHVPLVKFALYPFMLFSVWVHEMCHGMAAVCVGGGITKLYVYKDGSGLAYTWTTGEDWKRAVVASAGYTGTAILGAFFLVFRRTRRGPTVGLIGIGCAMILSCVFYVRNSFGVIAVLALGATCIIGGWKLPEKRVLYLYCFMAATCSFNALDSINDLFNMREGEAYVNGQASSTDAHTVAELWGLTYTFWAMVWLLFGLFMSVIGVFFPFNGLTYRKKKNEQRRATGQVKTQNQTQQQMTQQFPQPPPPSAPVEPLPKAWVTQDLQNIPMVSATIL